MNELVGLVGRMVHINLGEKCCGKSWIPSYIGWIFKIVYVISIARSQKIKLIEVVQPLIPQHGGVYVARVIPYDPPNTYVWTSHLLLTLYSGGPTLGYTHSGRDQRNINARKRTYTPDNYSLWASRTLTLMRQANEQTNFSSITLSYFTALESSVWLRHICFNLERSCSMRTSTLNRSRGRKPGTNELTAKSDVAYDYRTTNSPDKGLSLRGKLQLLPLKRQLYLRGQTRNVIYPGFTSRI